MKLKDWNQEWWNADIDFYMRLKLLCEKFPKSDSLKESLAKRREQMVTRYGETAMKGI